MNKLLTFVLAVLPMLVQAQVTFKINEKCEVPKKDVQIEGTKVIVTYDFPEMTEIVDPKTNEFLYHEIPGFGQCSEVGMPKLPMRIDTFYVPDGYEMSVSASGVLASTKDCSYMAVQAPAPDGLGPQTVNYEITPYDDVYPKSTASLVGAFNMRNKRYADIAVSPVQYDYDNQKAYI